jgi:general secretion pathway protein F
VFHRTLAEFTRQGMPLPKAFRLLAEELSKGRLRKAAFEMAAETESGMPLAEAYGRRKESFPKLYRALIEAGQASGDVPGVLTEIAEHARTRAVASRRLRKALAYPLVTAIFVLAVGGGALAFAAPKLWRLPTGLTESPITSRTMADSPAWFVFSAPGMLWVSFGFVVLFVVGAFLATRWASPVDFLPGLRVPVIGPLRLASVRASFASALAMLLRRKTPLPTACELVTEMFDDRKVRGHAADMVLAARNGESLPEALGRSALFPKSLLWLVETAEGDDAAADALDDVAAVYRNRLDRGLDRMEVLVTPMAELVIGVAVFFFAYSYLIPLLEYSGAILGIVR